MSFFSSLLGGIATIGTGGLAGPLISAGASLLGGALNNKAEKAGIAAQNAYNDPAQIRARAEKAGFNPLSFIGPGVGNQTAAASGSYMGSAIADAGMAIAEGIANRTKKKQAEQLGALEIENAKLQNKLLQLTLRPKVGGVYAERQSTPTIAAAVGAKGSANGSVGAQVSSLVPQNSPLAGDVVGPDDGNLTGVQLAVKKDVPAFRLFGHNFYGTGAFSTAQQVEDSVGESEIVSGLYAPVVIGDAFLNEAYKGVVAGAGYIKRNYPSAGSYDPFRDDPADHRKASASSKKRVAARGVPRWNNTRPMFGGGY